MIKLKNGKTIEYDDNFDFFFKNLLDTIIAESKSTVDKKNPDLDDAELLNEYFLKELMDNCIYVTNQLFEISKTNENMSKFMVTGFIFNSIIITVAQKKSGTQIPGLDQLNGKLH